MAKTGKNSDEITLNKVDSPNESYILPAPEGDVGGEGARNWFLALQAEVGNTREMTYHEEYFSLKDTLEDIMAHEEAGEVLRGMLENAGGTSINEGMMKMLGKIKLEKIMSMAGAKLPESVPALLNGKLQRIKK